MLALSADDLAQGDFQTTSAGYYLERHQGKYIFLYQNLTSGKAVLAATPIVLENLPFDTIRFSNSSKDSLQEFFGDKNPVFKDIDYGISGPMDFRPCKIDEKLRVKTPAPEEIEFFLKLCSEDDVDTLDLTFENEVVLGIYFAESLLGIARYALVRDTGLADITVLVGAEYRGNGYSTPLVSKILELSLAAGLVPKYRVDRDNLSSQAIAERLGFKKMSTLTIWESPS